MNEISVTQLDSLTGDFLALSKTYTGDAPADPYPILAEMRQQTPVMQGDILARYHVPSQADYANSGRPVMTVFRYADVLAILRDPVTWKSYILADGFGASVENLLLTAMDGPDHKKFRALFSPPFAVGAIQRMQKALMRPLIRDEFAEKLRLLGKADLVRDFSLRSRSASSTRCSASPTTMPRSCNSPPGCCKFSTVRRSIRRGSRSPGRPRCALPRRFTTRCWPLFSRSVRRDVSATTFWPSCLALSSTAKGSPTRKLRPSCACCCWRRRKPPAAALPT